MHAEGLLVRGGELKIKEMEVQCYLFVLLGSTLFVDKSRDRLRPAINLFLKDHRRLADYAWGAGALAYLYRQLGVATRAGSKGLCGCLTLLQAWIYEYFPLFRPSQLPQSPDAPRASSWISPRLPGGDEARQRLVRYPSPSTFIRIFFVRCPHQIKPKTLCNLNGCFICLQLRSVFHAINEIRGVIMAIRIVTSNILQCYQY
ncbi:unnamed protein product [Linum tenue]|nr:unnamed protein product [Linum tenue]